MSKDMPVTVGSVLSTQDISAWFIKNPILPSLAETVFPLIKSEQTTWKTISNSSNILNEAADPMSLNSPIPVSTRGGFSEVIGEMTTFGKGYEWTADQIEKYERLKRNLSQFKNASAAAELLDYYGADLARVRTAMDAQMAYMDWSIVSNACNYSFLQTNSPYMQGITAMDYGVATWQKDAVSASWALDTTKILDDIQYYLELGEDKGKEYTYIYLNKKSLGWVRANTQIKNQAITLVGSLVGADVNPNLEAINTMMESYFDLPVKFVMINEKVSRESLTGVKTTSNPFQDGVAIFAQESKLGHFEWNQIPIIDPTKETLENFYVVGNYTRIDPSYAKIYGKGRAFPVIDTFADNMYVKIDATSW